MADTGSRRPLIIVVIAGAACLLLVLLVAIAGVIGVVVLRGSDADPSEPAPAAEIVAPPGVAEDQPYLELSTSEDGPVVDLYLDFLCPHCATFHETHGVDLETLAGSGEITLRVHPRPMLDANSSPAGYSGRAANAALAAYAATEDPQTWFDAERALFGNQPGEEGLTDEELVERIQEATGVDVSEDVAAGTYLPWLQEVVEPEALQSVQGTPVVMIDGEIFEGDLAAAGSVREAIERA
ncbi:DsbA family protein [Brachybacterium sp. J153]|uniref:DsbA family protein n=1 Tax=Brachybacterium sp. J153 TaxID=3116488 RepID=UPI002E787346|nr:thioredoxin domain-containing protein [Brachybacterium sp. J153]MEE1618403.1 thioredoxin domain-containing protein [Brachybacterium sp. J153]